MESFLISVYGWWWWGQAYPAPTETSPETQRLVERRRAAWFVEQKKDRSKLAQLINQAYFDALGQLNSTLSHRTNQAGSILMGGYIAYLVPAAAAAAQEELKRWEAGEKARIDAGYKAAAAELAEKGAAWEEEYRAAKAAARSRAQDTRITAVALRRLARESREAAIRARMAELRAKK